jgi:hypothetical protein
VCVCPKSKYIIGGGGDDDNHHHQIKLLMSDILTEVNEEAETKELLWHTDNSKTNEGAKVHG